jgi:hypothetical protein
MRQSSTVESSRPAANGQAAPHPVLSTALSTLDIQLEAELSRYRRAKAGNRVQRTTHRASAKPLDLIAVAASPTPAQPLSLLPETRLATSVPSYPSDISEPEAHLLHTPIDVPDPDLAEPEVELDDYLASSEELLRSLSEEEAKVEAEQGFMQSLVTPLGVGSMLLLLLSSAMFGYVVTNPTSLTNLFADRDNTAQPAAPIAIAPNPGSTDAPQPNLANKEFKDLNLNTLGSLKPGSKARTGAATPSATQKPSVPATSTTSSSASGAAPTGVVQIESNAQNPQPIPAAPRAPEQPAPEPAPAQQAYSPAPEPVRDRAPAPLPERREAPPAAAPSPAEDYSYKVVAPYNGDSSLAEARRVVPDAFLTNSAGKAENQLGAHSSAADAETQVQELRRQGIQAEVQKR